MAFSSVLAREKMRDDYLAAFREVNSESPAPVLFYEDGWWCFYGLGGTAYSPPYKRIRSSELEIMTRRLRDRL